MEPPGGESGNIERTWGMYNKPQAAVHPLLGPHTTTTTTTTPVMKTREFCIMACFKYLFLSSFCDT
jgi:hypothetical protein